MLCNRNFLYLMHIFPRNNAILIWCLPIKIQLIRNLTEQVECKTGLVTNKSPSAAPHIYLCQKAFPSAKVALPIHLLH